MLLFLNFQGLCDNLCVVRKIRYSMVWCSAFVLGVDVQVTREDDTVTGAVGKIRCRVVWYSAYELGADVHITREDNAVISGRKNKQ